MPDYILSLSEEEDMALAYQTEELNVIRAGHFVQPGVPLEPLTVADVLVLRVARALEPSRQRVERTARTLEAILLPLTPAQRVALIQRIPSAAVRQRVIDLLRDR